MERNRVDKFLDEVRVFMKDHEKFKLAALASHLGYIDLHNFVRSKLPIILEHFQDCLTVVGSGTNLLFINKCYEPKKNKQVE